jgi:hypothetical protein
MGKLSEREDAWQAEATAEAVAEARAVVQGQAGIANTLAGKLSDQQWGWMISAAIFSWIKVRYQQAIQEGINPEAHVSWMSPSPHDTALVQSILPALCDQAPIDWSKPVASWSRKEMTDFLDLSWALIEEAKTALEQEPVLLHKPAEKAFDDSLPF